MAAESLKRIGVYGGGFDPVHVGHMHLASTALRVLSLDQVLFVPSAGQAHYKDISNIASADHRVTMLKLAIGEEPRFSVCTREVDHGKFCYTIDTLRALRETFPEGSELILLVGGDWKDRFHMWHEGDKLVREFTVALFTRPGSDHPTKLEYEPGEERILYVQMPPVEAASSKIRAGIAAGDDVSDKLHPSVWDYIQHHGLYKKGGHV